MVTERYTIPKNPHNYRAHFKSHFVRETTMSSPSPDPGIQSWFTDLIKMQAASINNSVRQLPPLGFANAVITVAFPTTAAQNNYLTSAAAATGYPDLATADLTTYKTFRALLDYSHL